MSKKNFLEKIRVETPCSEDWNEMRGNDKVRFCSHCLKSVNNLSELTRREALKIVRESNGNLCVRYVKNPIGNAPLYAEDLYKITRRAPRLAVGVVAAALSLSAAAYAQGGVRATREPQEKTETSQEKDASKNKIGTMSATLSGTVIDSAGAVIPGVSIILTNDQTGEQRAAASNEDGFYEIKSLSGGTYTLKANAPAGFSNHQIEQLKIADGENSKLEVPIAVAEITSGAMVIMPEYSDPLFNAVNYGTVEEVMDAAAKSANVNVREENSNNITPLFLAVENGNAEIAQTLLNFGAKVNVRDADKKTPLMSLDSDATPELARLLISYGSKIRAVDRAGNTILHHTVFAVSGEVLQILIDEGASLDAQNRQGETALMIAAAYDNLAAVKILLAAGADVSLRDEDGKTALDKARAEDYLEIAELLVSYGATEEK